MADKATHVDLQTGNITPAPRAVAADNLSVHTGTHPLHVYAQEGNFEELLSNSGNILYLQERESGGTRHADAKAAASHEAPHGRQRHRTS
jgi:hypothetical protein